MNFMKTDISALRYIMRQSSLYFFMYQGKHACINFLWTHNLQSRTKYWQKFQKQKKNKKIIEIIN